MRLRRAAVPVALAGLLILQASWFQATTSATYDETIYLRLGVDAYQRGTFEEFVNQGVAPLPVLIAYWPAAIAAVGDPLDPAHFRFLIGLARATHLLLVGVPLMLCVYMWLARRHGATAGAAGAALLILSPNMVAHASLATTDASFVLCALLGLAALDYYATRPSVSRFWVMALAIGAAQASKYSAVFLFPVVALVLLWVCRRTRSSVGFASSGHAVTVALRQLVLVGAVAMAVVWLLHGLSLAPMISNDGRVERTMRLVMPPAFVAPTMTVLRDSPVPAPVKGFANQMNHVWSGDSAFLMGERSTTGWWSYFPLAFLVKSTPADLLLTAAVPLLILWNRRGSLYPTVWLWSAALVTYGSLALSSSLNLGVRYVLLVWVLIILLAIDRMATLARTARTRVVVAATVALALQLASAATIAPHYLSYFTVAVGGPSEGYRWLVDSNLDWGQDLPALRASLEAVGAQRPLVAYFGTAPLAAYSLTATEWNEGQELVIGDADWLVISATYLVGAHVAGDPFSDFRELRPSARAGYTFFLYEASRPDVQKAIATAHTKLARPRAGSWTSPPSTVQSRASST